MEKVTVIVIWKYAYRKCFAFREKLKNWTSIRFWLKRRVFNNSVRFKH